jgi:catecholate siderophore receptor
MAHIKSRKHNVARALPSRLSHTTAALALMAAPAAVFAQQTAPAAADTLPAVKVKAAVENDYKAEKSSSPKFTQPLVDTPQTITVIKKEILLQQGATTLSEALRNTPGITFQMGENGNTQTGDSIFMRGFDTQQSIFVDGIRDIGTVSRDVFNLEQVEVVKGPAGADIGRGSPTGYVNLSTKLPTLESFSAGTVTVGSGDKKRLTVDVNQAVPALGDGTAFRLNLMKEDSGKVHRDWVKNESWAFAPSVAFGLNSPTRAYLYYLHVEQDNRPDGGITTFGRPGYIKPAALANVDVSEVSERNYYGSLNDYDRVKADMFTARFEHDLKPGVTLRNISRFGRTEQKYVLTGINNVFVDSTQAGAVLTDPSTWKVGRNRQGKDQENQILTNQTNLNAEFATGGIKHSLSSGIEFIHEKQTNVTMAADYSGFGDTGCRTTNSSGVVTQTLCGSLYNPNANDVFAPVVANGQRASGATTTAAIYAFDTLKLSEAFQVNGGLRFEKYKTTSDNIVEGATAGTLAPQSLSKADDLITWKVGGLWKPASNGSVYIAYATSQKPPGSDSFALNATATNANNPNLDPSEAKSIELGTKWELLDNRLALTAALFQSETKNDVVDTDAATGAPVQVGEKTVKGIELGAAGMLSNVWQISTGIAFLDTEINATTRANTATQQGSSLAWSPKVSFTSWTTYKLPMGFTVGGGARYQRSVVRNSNNNISTNLPSIPSYWVYDAMAAYEVTKNVSLQLNVYNLADKDYIQSMNNGGSRYVLGAPRSATLTANVKF